MRQCRPSTRRALWHTGDHTRAVRAPQYADSSKEPTVEAPPVHIHIRCHSYQLLPLQCGKQGACVGALHRRRPRRANGKCQHNCLQPLGRTLAMQVTGLHNSQHLVSHGRSPNRTFL